MENIIAMLGSMFLVFFILVIVLYVLGSLGLMKIAQSKGVENAWLAWIPVANMYILGKITGPFKLIFDITKPEIIMPVLSLCGFIPGIGFLFSLATAVLYYGAIYKVFSEYKAESATTMLILSIVFFFMGPIYLFNIGRKV
ncbi:MAG: hypothetical protein ACM3UU_03565 [Ignavibacteriales bacterium]